MDTEEDVILCDWCEENEGFYTDTDRWACEACADKYRLNTRNCAVEGFRRRIR